MVGGGPAGSTLATLVAMQGHRVLLLERARFPRYQIGESLLPATIHGICRLLGVYDEIRAAGFVRKGGGTWRWGREPEPWSFDFSERPELTRLDQDYSFQVERSKFDNILLENARKKGVEVREEHSVLDVVESRGRISGVTCKDAGGHISDVPARFVADASGNQSPLYTRVGRRHYSRFFQNIALFAYYENGGRMPAPKQGNIFCEAFAEGWFWYIPLTDSMTSVGAVIAREHAAALKQDPETAMNRFIAGAPHIRALLKNATRVQGGDYGRFRIRKDFSYTTTHFWKPGMLLAGDAACFVDPILSTGVHLATYSALLAARSVNTCLAEKLSTAAEAHVFDEFEYRYRAEFGVTYEFLVSFYDRYRDHESYFWQARKILKTTERANHAFIRLVSGGATTGDEFFNERTSLGQQALSRFSRKPVGHTSEHTTEHTTEHTPGGAARRIFKREETNMLDPNRVHPPAEKPVRAGGLIATDDRMRWVIRVIRGRS